MKTINQKAAEYETYGGVYEIELTLAGFNIHVAQTASASDLIDILQDVQRDDKLKYRCMKERGKEYVAVQDIEA